jgi:hypothetical protein
MHAPQSSSETGNIYMTMNVSWVGNVAAVDPRAIERFPASNVPGSAAVDAFGTYSPAQQTRVVRAAPTEITQTIRTFPSFVEDIQGDVRRLLDEIVKEAQATDLQRIEITAYAFKELARPGVRAAKEYLISKGIREDLISTKVSGGEGIAISSSLARSGSVEIAIVGTPKLQDASTGATAAAVIPALV